MPNQNQQYLSESETSKIKSWLSLPDAQLFKRAISAEILLHQFEGAKFQTAKDRKPDNAERAARAFKYADDLQCIVDKMTECLAEEYRFYNIQINP